MASIISAGTTSATALNMSADTSGVLQLASNNGTVALTVNTSQNVGIGTSSPTQKLEVSGRVLADSMSVSSTVFLWSQNRMSLGASIGLESQQSTPLWMMTNTTQPIVFGTNSTERMRIDASGRVTVPSQPAFYVYANGADTYSGTGWQKARMATYATPNEFNTSQFNFSTNTFTAPVAGRYLFSAAITMTGSTNTDGTIGFAINGASYPNGGRSMAYSSGTGLGGMDCVNILNLAANDTVALYFYQSGSQTTRNTQYAGYLCGYLLG